jgi:hypothetical protein
MIFSKKTNHMKLSSTLLTISFLALMMLLIQAKRPVETKSTFTFQADTVIEYSLEVKAIIDQKCFGCHNTNSKNEKGKAKIQWDVITTLSKAKQIAVMDDVLEVLEEGSMPPEKFLANKPEAKLTVDEIKLLKEWANANADRLMN